jgi:arabinose-5-phosphate isomerase
MTGAPQSALALASDAHLNTGVATEACPLDLAPTSSTTCALVMGDALAIALLEARGFSAEDFAFSHPGGALGKRLLLKVEDVMRRGAAIPRVTAQTRLGDALLEISAKGLGMTTVFEGDRLAGVFTDGDLRRALDRRIDIVGTPIGELISRHPATVHSGMLAAEALRIMEERHISALPVLDHNEQLCGVINLLGLLEAGLA